MGKQWPASDERLLLRLKLRFQEDWARIKEKFNQTAQVKGRTEYAVRAKWQLLQRNRKDLVQAVADEIVSPVSTT